jgi:Xaa-Pro aminopeptidase
MRFSERRSRLLEMIDRPALLFSGGFVARNYPANTFPFRADSNFLYFFERPEPGSAAFFDPKTREVVLFLPNRSVADALWHGEVETFAAASARHGVMVCGADELQAIVQKMAAGRQVDTLALADERATETARGLTGAKLDFYDPSCVGRPQLVEAIARLRIVKDDDELAEIRRAVSVTRDAHLAAMRRTAVGGTEQGLAGVVEGIFASEGCTAAYSTILSVRGEVLHNHSHSNSLTSGDLVLLDGGAERIETGYCADVTRAWPVNGRFSPEARAVYELVLAAEREAIALVRPGARFRSLHLAASRVIIDGLLQMGLLEGSPDALLEAGAHAMFFPHGLGHLLGLDVHDMESFGDRIHYPEGRARSTQFGLCYLRMDLDLRAGMTFTIEPGLYFVPAIINSQEFRAKFRGMVRFDEAERYLSMNEGRGFGGIRIEDDVLCGESGAVVLTQEIPARISEIEALVGADCPRN